MFSAWTKEDQTIWIAVIISVMIHGIFFTFSGTTFIQHAQFSVQPSIQEVEVSVISKNPQEELFQNVIARAKGVTIFKRTTNSKEIASSPSAPRNDTRVKANLDYFQNPSPEYPELAKQMGQEGLVRLSVDVDMTGEPINVEIIQSSGYRLLDQAALKAVSHWKFQPGSIGGIPVNSTVTVPIRFRLEK